MVLSTNQERPSSIAVVEMVGAACNLYPSWPGLGYPNDRCRKQEPSLLSIPGYLLTLTCPINDTSILALCQPLPTTRSLQKCKGTHHIHALCFDLLVRWTGLWVSLKPWYWTPRWHSLEGHDQRFECTLLYNEPRRGCSGKAKGEHSSAPSPLPRALTVPSTQSLALTPGHPGFCSTSAVSAASHSHARVRNPLGRGRCLTVCCQGSAEPVCRQELTGASERE
jgi:hypothetical protein